MFVKYFGNREKDYKCKKELLAFTSSNVQFENITNLKQVTKHHPVQCFPNFLWDQVPSGGN